MGMPHLRRGGGLQSRGHHGSLQSKKQHAERLAQQYALAELQAERLTLEARVMKLKSEVRKSSRTEYQRQTETFSGSSMNPVQQKDGRLSKNDRSTSGHEKQLLLVSNGATMLSPGERVGAVRAGKSSAQGASRCAKQQAAPGEQSEESAGSAKGPHGRPHSIVEQIDVESLETADPAIGLYVGTWSELGLPDWQFPLVQGVSEEDVSALRACVFGLDSFVVHEAESTPIGTILRGAMRKESAADVSAIVQARLAATPGLRERIRLFLLHDPTFLPDESELEPWEDLPSAEVVYLALPSSVVPLSAQRRGAAAPLAPPLSLLASAVTSGGFALSLCGAHTSTAAPVFGYSWALLAAHDAAHVLAARAGGLQLAAPIVLPAASLGGFGSHMPFSSFAANRSVLAEVSLAGPVVGGAASLASFFLGLAMTAAASEAELASFPKLPLDTLHASLLACFSTEVLLPHTAAMDAVRLGLELPPDQLPLHPLAVAGFVGMLCNSLALVPCGRLDGGRAATACFGRRGGSLFGGCSLIVLAIATLASGDPTLLGSWFLLVLPLLRQAEAPSVDEVTPPPPRYVNVFIGALAIAVLCIWPAPYPSTAELDVADIFAMSGIQL